MQQSEPKRNVAAIEPEVLMKKNQGRNDDMTQHQRRNEIVSAPAAAESTAALLRELVALLRQTRTQLRAASTRQITHHRCLTPITKEDTFPPTTPLYPNHTKS